MKKRLMNNMNPETILSTWINYCHERNLIQRVKDFWLLRDYVSGDVWAKEFYDRHKKDVIKILKSLNKDKEDVLVIINFFKKKGFNVI